MAARALCAPGPARVLLDGGGAADLADAVAGRVEAAGRPAVRVRAEHFLRPAGERFEHGREDPEALRTRRLDAPALEREVLAAARAGTYLPALRDPATDRSARTTPQPRDGCDLLVLAEDPARPALVLR